MSKAGGYFKRILPKEEERSFTFLGVKREGYILAFYLLWHAAQKELKQERQLRIKTI